MSAPLTRATVCADMRLWCHSVNLNLRARAALNLHDLSTLVAPQPPTSHKRPTLLTGGRPVVFSHTPVWVVAARREHCENPPFPRGAPENRPRVSWKVARHIHLLTPRQAPSLHRMASPRLVPPKAKGVQPRANRFRVAWTLRPAGMPVGATCGWPRTSAQRPNGREQVRVLHLKGRGLIRGRPVGIRQGSFHLHPPAAGFAPAVTATRAAPVSKGGEVWIGIAAIQDEVLDVVETSLSLRDAREFIEGITESIARAEASIDETPPYGTPDDWEIPPDPDVGGGF